jgi:AcrR family transcriptional regulator
MYREQMDSSEKLLATAQELLWERGFVGTSPRAIQERAGVGQGSMYHHFPSKAALARAAMERSAAELRALAEAALSGDGSPIERIANYVLRERDVLRGCRIGRLAHDPEIVTDPVLRAPIEETFRWLCNRLSSVVKEAQIAGQIDPRRDPHATAAAIASAVQGGYVLARAAGSPEPFDNAARGILALLGYDARSYPA